MGPKIKIAQVAFAVILFNLFIFSSPKNKSTELPDCPEFFFEGVGDLPGDCYFSVCTDISADGIRIIGGSYANDPQIPNDGRTCDADYSRPHSNQAFGWTRPCKHINFFPPPLFANGGMIGFGYGTPGQNALDAESYAYGISPDGKISVGYSNYDLADNSTAVVFLPGRVVKPLARLDVTAIARDISQTGPVRNHFFTGNLKTQLLLNFRIIVGYSTIARGEPIKSPGAKAVYWDSWDRIVPLPLPDILPSGQPVISSEAVCISDDGRTIGGNLYYDKLLSPTHYMSFGCIWKFDPFSREFVLAKILQDFPGGDDNTFVSHISGNGKIIVGRGNKISGDPSCYNYPSVACLWKLEGTEWKKPHSLMTISGKEISIAHGTNYDGSVIVGTCQNATCDFSTFENSPVLWHGGHQNERPVDIAAALGLKIPSDWILSDAIRVSNNGEIIIGYGFNSNGIEGWVARLPKNHWCSDAINITP